MIARQSAEDPFVGQNKIDHPDYGRYFCRDCKVQHETREVCPNRRGSYDQPIKGWTDDPRSEQEAIYRETT